MMTNRTLDFIRSYGEPTVYIQNIIPPNTRTYTEIQTFDTFTKKIIESLLIVFVVWDSNKKLIEFWGKLQGKALKNETIKNVCDKTFIYNSTGTDNLHTLDNIDQEWDNVLLVMITPKITVGVSYAPSQTTFDRMFVYTYPSCSPMTTHQMMMRVRHLKNNEVFILFQPQNVLNRCKNRPILYKILDKLDSYNDSIKQTFSQYLHFLLKMMKKVNLKMTL